jgi:hypothetical protein
VPGVRTSPGNRRGATPFGAPGGAPRPGRRTPAPARVEGGRALGRKGIGSRSPNRRRGTDRRGNAREPRDAGGGPEEGSLSSLTAARVRRGTRPDGPGIGSPGEGAGRLAGHPSLRGVREAPHRAYYNTISWRNDTSPLPMENRPRAIFERLFGEAGTTSPEVRMALRAEDRSILDAILADVRRLRGKLGGADRGKIDQYLEAIRDVERRMQLADKQGDREMPQIEGPAGAPEVFSEYFKLMTDLMVLAWQTDMTRVITFMMGHEMSGRAYPEVGFGDAHHPCTHHQGDPEKIEKTVKINTFHTKMLAYYFDKLRATKDGDGSLLDHSLILYGAALSDANLHLYTDLPLLLMGGGVAGIKGGQHVRYPKRTPLTNLLLTMLDKANVPNVERLGDSTKRLELPTA